MEGGMLNVKLRTKLIGGFAAVAAITLLVGGLGWKILSDSSESEAHARFLQTVSGQLLQREIDHLNWAVKVGEFQRNEEMTELGVEKDDRKCKFGKWYYSDDRKNVESALPEIKPLLEKIEEPHRKMHESAGKIEELLKKGKQFRPDAIALFQQETLPRLKGVQQVFGEIRSKVEELTEKVEKETAEQTDRGKLILSAVVITGVLVAMTFGIILSLLIIRPLNRVIHGLSAGADEVASSSSQISLTSQSLAEGTSEQAAAIEETSSSLEEMSSMTKQNAQNANQADILMKKSIEVTVKAQETMTLMTASMNEIAKASEDTQKIIKTIDEIAFQTNLLALNAAVEAARAGEAGAGFAVVADEVRSLAMRAAEAAKNTQALIETIVKKIRTQTDLVFKSSEGFSDVSSSIQQVGDLLGEITAASDEQAQGIEQINKAVAEMDKVTQQNAASAEESAAASEEMSGQAESLKGFVAELTTLVAGGTGVDGVTTVTAINRRRASQERGRQPKTIVTATRSGNGLKKNLLPSAKQMDARKRIPFDDGELSDF